MASQSQSQSQPQSQSQSHAELAIHARGGTAVAFANVAANGVCDHRTLHRAEANANAKGRKSQKHTHKHKYILQSWYYGVADQEMGISSFPLALSAQKDKRLLVQCEDGDYCRALSGI